MTTRSIRWTRILAMVIIAAGCSANPSGSTPASVGASTATTSAAASAAPSKTASTPKPVDPATGFHDVGGGRKLWLECRGSGSPTIVMEVGNDDTIHGSWDLVFTPMAQVSHVCAYDRANQGKSDPAPVRTIADAAEDLVTLLRVANVPGPYLFVGGSFGGNLVGVLAAAHPDLVAGTVFVDSEPANIDPKLDPLKANLTKQVYAACCAGFGPPAADDPENTDRIDYAAGLKVELASIDKQPKVPTRVLTATHYDCASDWPCDAIVRSEAKLQRQWIAGNPDGTQTMVESGHVMQREAPLAIVEAAKSVLAALQP